MFKKLQWKLTFFYTFLLIVVMLVANIAVYALLESTNNQRLSNEISQLLTNIEGSEWLAENHDLEEYDDDEREISINAEHQEEEVEILIPTSLQKYAYYTIHNNQGLLLDTQRPNKEVGDSLYPYDLALQVNTSPELIELEKGVYYIMAKTSIVIDGIVYGNATIAENVSLVFETLDQLIRVMIILTGIGSVFAFLIGYVLSGKVIKPIYNAYKLKEEFIGNASHELRTPISIILLSMDILKREKNKLSALGQETLDDVADETNKMRQLVDKLLFVARNDAKNLVIEEEQVNLTDLVTNNIYNYKKIARAQNIDIQLNQTAPYYVFGDRKLLDSVVSTLLDNAVKYNKMNGTVEINLSIKTIKGKRMVEFVVSDTGIGIPDKDYDQVFERFHRQDTSRSKEKEGYGLGLSIAKDIVLAHKGHIFVESKEGDYTKMIVQLPNA